MHEIFRLPSISKFWEQSSDTWGMCLPKSSIYHYTSSVMTVKNILSEGELWMSKSTVMNDFSEIAYGVELAKEMLSEVESEDEWFLKLSDELPQQAFSNFSDYFILSFSQNGNSRLLWDSYSNKNGYNIEFSKEFISDFIKSTPYLVKTFKDSAFVPVKEGLKIHLKTQKDEFTIPGFAYEAFANLVLYDRDKQCQIISEIIEYIKVKKPENKQIDISLALSALMQSLPFFKDP